MFKEDILSIAVCKHGSSWHVAGARVARAAYRAFSADRLDCWLAVHVGLGHVNVSLTGNKLLVSYKIILRIIVIQKTSTESTHFPLQFHNGQLSAIRNQLTSRDLDPHLGSR